jgi:hypothetical protein
MIPALLTKISTPAELRLNSIEHGANRIGIANIGLYHNGVSARLCDLIDYRLCGCKIASKIYCDGNAIASQTFSDCRANPTRCARHDRTPTCFCHLISPSSAFATARHVEDANCLLVTIETLSTNSGRL